MLTEHFTDTHWWIAAVVAGLALATAMATMVDGIRAKLVAGGTIMLVTAACTALRGSGEGSRQALQLYILGTLTLAILRCLFAGWIRRQQELKRAGEPMEALTRRQTWTFVAAMFGVIAGLAFTLGQ